MTSTPTNGHDAPRIDHGAAALWASAMVILALVIVQAGRLGSGQPALAGNVAEVANLRLLTVDVGNDEDVLAVINHGDETISVYCVEQGRALELFQVEKLDELFNQARRIASGGRR